MAQTLPAPHAGSAVVSPSALPVPADAPPDGAAEVVPAPQGHVVGSDDKLQVYWKNGVEIESASKDFRMHIGGRTQVDSIWLTDPNDILADTEGTAGAQDAVDMRRARFRAEGTFYELYEFALEIDFVNSTLDDVGAQPGSSLPDISNAPAPTDAWFEFKEVPWVGHIRAGQFKEPLGMEHNTSSRFLEFLERSFNQDAFTGAFNNGFSLGVMAWDNFADDRVLLAAGIFKNNSNGFGFGVGDGEGAFTARATALPYYDEPSEGRYLVHIGGNVSIRDPDEGTVRIRSRGSLRNGPGAVNPVLVDTDFVACDTQFLLGPELAAVWGPWTFQSEYLASLLDSASLDGVALGNVWTHGYYAEALYFLTGEHRHYEKNRGAFGRVVPFENAAFIRDAEGRRHMLRGAWQVGVRYSNLNLNDGLLDGGQVQDLTFGVNWFFNPMLKLQFNYVLTHRLAPGGTPHGDYSGVGLRLAHDF